MTRTRLFLLLLAVSGLPVVAGQVPVYANKAVEYRHSVENCTAPDGETGIRLSWNDSPTGYAELFLRKPIDAGKLCGQKVAIPFLGGKPDSVRQLNLRLRDGKGETFQFSPLDRTDAGQMTFLLDPDKFHSVWGGDGNRIPDGNTRIVSIIVVFAQPKNASGDVMLALPRVINADSQQ